MESGRPLSELRGTEGISGRLLFRRRGHHGQLQAHQERKKRKPRADGERTRAAILTEATLLATLHGLGGLTIGRLADLTGMSKSGLFAHFGSKENLQLAVVATAAKCAQEEYTGPATEEDSPIEKVWNLCDRFLSFVERRVFPGGCFFAAVTSEMHALPDMVWRRIERYQNGYLKLQVQWVKGAILSGELKTNLEAEQIAFELHSLIITANTLYKIHGDASALERAWDGVRRLLGDTSRARSRPAE